MTLRDITRDAVRRAISEFDELGRDRFLIRYRFGPARRYFLFLDGQYYDSKAILGAAHGFARPDQGQLFSDEFNGGEETTGTLRRLGFDIETVETGVVGDLPTSRGSRYWWSDIPSESFWLESTDRADLGANLHAPQQDDAGTANWRYSLVLQCQPGDFVFHYHKDHKAVIARSVVDGPAIPSTILWGARGASARRRNAVPRERDSWLVPLRDFYYLPQPLSLDELRDRRSDLLEIRSGLESRHRKPIYFPFELSERRPARMLQGYIFKFPTGVVSAFPQLATAVDLGDSERQLGGSYIESDEQTTQRHRKPFEVDPDAIDRGLRSHAKIQNATAQFLRDNDVEPKSPSRGEPPYDLAWTYNGSDWVAEVKSTTPENEERQMRLGLGQVLRYRQQMALLSGTVNAALIVERSPLDPNWIVLGDSLGVSIAWPGDFTRLGVG